DTVLDAHLDRGAFFVVVPGHELERFQLPAGRIVTGDIGEGAEPGLAAVLVNNAVHAPRRDAVVESLLRRADSVLAAGALPCSVEAIEIRLSPITGIAKSTHPGETAVGKAVAETSRVFKDEERIAGNVIADVVPIDAERFHAEVEDHGTAIELHIAARLH